MRLPQIQIQQQPIKLDIQSQRAQVDIRQRRADVQIETSRPPMEAQSYRPVLSIDQTDTWNAITGGKPEAFTQRIYSQTGQYAQQHAIRTIQKWRQVSDLSAKENPIPDMAAAEAFRERSPLPVYGEASVFNTRIHIDVRPPDIEIQPWKVNIDVQTHKPEVDYQPAKVNVAVAQYPTVTIIPPPQVELMA